MLFCHEPDKPSRQALADQIAAQRGDARAVGRLLAAHSELIYALSYRILGNEQAAVAAAQTAARLVVNHTATLPANEFQLWLVRWVVTACQEYCRQADGRQMNLVNAVSSDSSPSLPGSLYCLPLELRLALVLVDVTGLDYAQAAVVLGAGREQVSGWVAEGRARLIAR